MKNLFWGSLLGLAGCATIDNVSVFNIDEQTLQSVAKTQLSQQMESLGGLQIGDSNLVTLNWVLDDLDLDLVAADGGAVVAGFDSTLNSTLPLLGTVKTRLNPKVQAGLELRDQAIYLINPRILSLGMGDSLDQQLQSVIGANGDALTQALSVYFQNQPIYRLDDSPETRLAGRFLNTLKIGDDRISLTP